MQSGHSQVAGAGLESRVLSQPHTLSVSFSCAVNEMGIQAGTNRFIFVTWFWLGQKLFLFHLSLDKAISYLLKGLEKNWTKDQAGGHNV